MISQTFVFKLINKYWTNIFSIYEISTFTHLNQKLGRSSLLFRAFNSKISCGFLNAIIIASSLRIYEEYKEKLDVFAIYTVLYTLTIP